MDTITNADYSVSDTSLYRKVRWRILPFLCMAMFLAYLDRVNVAFAKLQMAPQLGMTDAVYGLGAGVFFISYFLFEIPSNLMMARYGARRWFARIMISWGLLSAAMIFVSGPVSFYCLRFALGAAEAGFFPGVILYLGGWFPPAERGKVVAIFMSVVPISNIVGGPLSGTILNDLNGFWGLAGWQWLFLIEGVPAAAIGIACLFLIDNTPDEARWLSVEERFRLATRLEEDNPKVPAFSFLDALKSLRLWHLAFVNFTIGLGFLAVQFWLPTLLHETGVKSALTIGWLMAGISAIGFLSMVLTGRSADRQGERRYHLALPMLLGAAGLLLSTSGGSIILVIVGITMAVAGLSAALPMFWPLAAGFLSDRAKAGGFAFMNSANALAGFAGPVSIGWLRTDTGYTWPAFAVITVVVVLGAAAVMATPAPKEYRR